MADITNITRRTALKALPFEGAAVAIPVASAAPLVDQALLELGTKFEAAFAAEEPLRLATNDTDDLTVWNAWEAASSLTEEIVNEIERMPATSIEGLRVKARCILWCSGDGSVSISDGKTADYRLAQQIVTSLLAA